MLTEHAFQLVGTAARQPGCNAGGPAAGDGCTRSAAGEGPAFIRQKGGNGLMMVLQARN